MFTHIICAFLAPALAAAAAFPWAPPQPTLVVPAPDNWSPAPTKAPHVGAIELFRRAGLDNTCGFISGISTSSLTCYNSDYVCATNTYYGVHGCCDPNDMSACSIPTTCIPSSLMSASCTNSVCSDNGYIAKCTGTEAPNCYEWLYVYSTERTTTLTEYGCAAEAATMVIERTWSGMVTTAARSELQASGTEGSGPTKTTASSTTTDVPATTSPTAMQDTEHKSKSNNTGAIVGGAIGGLIVLGAIAWGIVYLILRNRRLEREAATVAHQSWISGQSGPAPGVTEFNPNGFMSGMSAAAYDEQQHKAWSPHKVHHSPNNSMSPECAGQGATLFGVVETAGTPVHEAPTYER